MFSGFGAQRANRSAIGAFDISYVLIDFWIQTLLQGCLRATVGNNRSSAREVEDGKRLKEDWVPRVVAGGLDLYNGSARKMEGERRLKQDWNPWGCGCGLDLYIGSAREVEDGKRLKGD